ncbi:SDR family oxidoreductase [Pseudomonas abietaniphila]|uniref:NAD(P)-dependent dehydrogenase, short-chain alcohol dehydrogenase family n=1 Tax=Pseudomonas abietaniphila TaxID=89065 RepID=A0A1G8L928_9PSED|nr:SDR family oxidoreductase [Pseudomonas abietaniphila]SDI52146.1 NAD(P)-dependent dehydrogenase, short-chain alcohol dehydrogenase family [Pseudomonas abietaniphila]
MNTARFDFSGQRVLVTGASSGIGWEVAQQLLSAGAGVYAMGRDAAALDTLAGQGCKVLRVDMADQVQLASILAQLPVMHGLVNCAGISILEAATEVSASAFDQVMTVNVRAAAMVAASVAKAMIGEGVKGSIVNVSSQASLVALNDHLSYCASKGAMDAMTRVQCGEWGKHGIRVNSVNPTVTLTPMAQMAWSEPSKRDPALAAIPLGRFAETSEVAAPILFLLSDAASMISGVSLPIDGGYTSK